MAIANKRIAMSAHPNRRLVITALILLFALSLALSSVAQAQSICNEYDSASCAQQTKNRAGFVPLADYGTSIKAGDIFSSQNLGEFMNKLFVGAISLGAILAVLRLAWAGFVYMGTDMWGKKEQAKEIIQDVLLGLFLLLAMVLILRQINPEILNLDAARTIKANPTPTATARDTTEIDPNE